MKLPFKPRGWHFVIGFVVILVASFEIHSYVSRYDSWTNLSKPKLVESANWYVRNRAPGSKVCLYGVTCYKGTARLELVKDIETWDLDAAKQLAWDRRFNEVCPGRTANFALEVAPGDIDPESSVGRAVWSFGLDRFTPRWGRFHGPNAFSEMETESCSDEYAIASANILSSVGEEAPQ